MSADVIDLAAERQRRSSYRAVELLVAAAVISTAIFVLFWWPRR